MLFKEIRDTFKVLATDNIKTQHLKRISRNITIICVIEKYILLIPYYLLNKNKKYGNFIERILKKQARYMYKKLA